MAKYRCTYCQNVILTCRIKCVQCPDFDLCLQCFACGVEAGSHKKDHNYQAVDDDFKIFQGSAQWLGTEEESLLEAVEQYGFGNWEDVANHVKTKKAEDCKQHYYAYYINGNIGKATFPNELERRTADVCRDSSVPSSTCQPVPPVELTLLQQQQLGYMPLRDDFEREYDNDAETIVSGLSLNYDGDDLDIEFKLAQVDMYRQKLRERVRRKRSAHKFSLIHKFSSTDLGNNVSGATPHLSNGVSTKKTPTKTPTKRRLSKDDSKRLAERLRVFEQFHSVEEHTQFLNDVQKEKKLKTKIKELMKYRRNGVTKLDEGIQYDEERMKREKKKENKKKMLSSNYLTMSPSACKRTIEKLGEENTEGITGDTPHCKVNTRGSSALSDRDLLSEREQKLCNSIAMKPASYITIKTCIIRDYLHRRQGVPVKIRYPNHLDKTHRRKILSFLSENGWIGGISAC